MYLRFVITQIDGNSKQPQGIFVAAYELLESGDLSQQEREYLRSILDWFNKHLPYPPDNFDARRAVFWYKSGAQECIKQMWELVYFLRHHGYHIEVHKCRRLTKIIYQDDLQVAAFPSNRDGRVTIQ